MYTQNGEQNYTLEEKEREKHDRQPTNMKKKKT